MRVAFYAPMKPPHHPVPSGDRTMARLLMQALRYRGHTVALASTFTSYDRRGDADRQRSLARLGEALAGRLIRHIAARPAWRRPELWFTYHVYHKAPDWLGPVVSRRLGIPYVVAEASHAPKQALGPWAHGHAAAAGAIADADRVIALNSADLPCLRMLIGEPERLAFLTPFIDAEPFLAAARVRVPTVATPHLVTVAMMRPGDKLASYRVLGRALSRLRGRSWRLTVVGDGTARADVAAAFEPVAGRVQWRGQVSPSDLPAVLADADLFVWPAVNEAYGLALLEAQAAGMPVLAGRNGGVPDVVADGATGILVPVGDPEVFAEAVSRLLDDPAGRRAMGRTAWERVRRHHDLPVAARRLDTALRALTTPQVPA